MMPEALANGGGGTVRAQSTTNRLTAQRMAVVQEGKRTCFIGSNCCEQTCTRSTSAAATSWVRKLVYLHRTALGVEAPNLRVVTDHSIHRTRLALAFGRLAPTSTSHIVPRSSHA